MTFAPAKDLKKPKYKKLDIFHDGWESIDLGNPPTGNEVVREVKTIISDIGNTTDKQKQQYINCDLDTSYYIKQYMDEHGLEYDEDTLIHIEQNCRPIINILRTFIIVQDHIKLQRN